MAQLRYTKYVAMCGTAALTAGLVGVYLYKRRAAKKEDVQRAKKDEGCEAEKKDMQETKPEPEVEHSAVEHSAVEHSAVEHSAVEHSAVEHSAVEHSAVEQSALEQSAVEQSAVEHSAAQDGTLHSPIAKSADQDVSQAVDGQESIGEEAQDMFAMLDAHDMTLETGLPEEIIPVEEPVAQSVQMSVESALPPCSGVPSGTPGYEEGGSTGSLTLDWAATMEEVEEVQKDESLVSPTMSLHSHPEGSLAGSDLSTETNSDSSSFDSGRCTGSTTSTGAQQLPQAPIRELPTVYQFDFPANECGRLIGKAGKNIKGIRSRSGAKVTLQDWPDDEAKQICILEGFQSEIDAALTDIQKKFPAVDTSKQYIESEHLASGVIGPEMTQIHLHDEIVNDVLVSSVVSAGHVFIQQPTHPTFMALNRLNAFMNNCYGQVDLTPELPRPIEVGVICAAPMMQGWYRAQIVDIYSNTDEVDLKFLDYGGYARTESYVLKQIRTDFMSLPFQANECYLSNIAPVTGEDDFSETARLFVEQVAQSFAILQAQVTGYSEDGVPFIELFYTDSERRVQSLNKELVNQGLVTWYEEGFEESSGDASLISEVEQQTAVTA